MTYSEYDIAVASLLSPDTSQYTSYSTILKYDESWPAILSSNSLPSLNDVADINSYSGLQSAIRGMHDQWSTPLPWEIADETYSVLPNALPIPPSHALSTYEFGQYRYGIGLTAHIDNVPFTHFAFQSR